MKFQVEWQSWSHTPDTFVVEGIGDESPFQVEADSLDDAFEAASQEAGALLQDRREKRIEHLPSCMASHIPISFPYIISLTDEMGNLKQFESRKKIAGVACDMIVEA